MPKETEHIIKSVHYKPNPVILALRKLTKSIVWVSSPKMRRKISSFALHIDKVVDFFKGPSSTRKSSVHSSFKKKIRQVRINGVSLPCIVYDDLNLSRLPAGLSYKRYRPYKFWHSPVDQFLLLRMLYKAEPRMMIKPICIVLNRYMKPTGFIVEKAEGESLGTLLKDKGLSLRDSIKIEQAVESFVKRLHRKGLSHGDLNPGNLIVDRGAVLKIIDPLELMPKRKAMKDDFAWVSYLKRELKNYRKRLSAGKG